MNWLIPLGWCAGWILLFRAPTLEHPNRNERRRSDAIRVSVIIPARNEVDRLPTLVESLRRQSRPADDIIVIDDDSSDGTGDWARAQPDLVVIDAPAIPPGWGGKNWACHNGAGRADGELLVFLDADVTLGTEALARLIGTWRRNGGLVSVQPLHVVERRIESLSAMFNIVAVMGLGIGSLVPPRQEWGAAGPCLALSAADYRRTGGHHAVNDQVAEDLALAERCRDANLPVTCAIGGHDARFRMYRSVRELIEGWSKNIASGATRTPLWRAVLIGTWVAALILVSIEAVTAGVAGHIALTGAWWTVGAAQVAWLGHQVGRFRGAALVWPVLIVAFLGVFTLSLTRTILLGRVRWSGRTLPVRPG